LALLASGFLTVRLVIQTSLALNRINYNKLNAGEFYLPLEETVILRFLSLNVSTGIWFKLTI